MTTATLLGGVTAVLLLVAVGYASGWGVAVLLCALVAGCVWAGSGEAAQRANPAPAAYPLGMQSKARNMQVAMQATVGKRSASPTPAPVLRRTTLVNDPAHPFSPSELAAMQRWVDRSYVPTYAGRVVVSKKSGGSAGATAMGTAYTGDVPGQDLPGQDGPGGTNVPMVTLGAADRKTLFHELGHVWQYHTMTDAQKAGLTKQLHGTGDFFAPGGTLEQAADSYMEAAIRGPAWKKWWDRPVVKAGRVVGVNTAGTAYDFRAGPKRYAALRQIFDGQ